MMFVYLKCHVKNFKHREAAITVLDTIREIEYKYGLEWSEPFE